MTTYIMCGPVAVRDRGSCGDGGEKEERRRMEKNQAGLKTQGAHQGSQGVTHVRNKKDPLITRVPYSCSRAERLNKWGRPVGEGVVNNTSPFEQLSHSTCDRGPALVL